MPELRMPAEWEKHSATLLTWPHNRETWPGERLKRVEAVYSDIIQTLHQYEKVYLLAADNSVKQRAEEILNDKIQNPANLEIIERSVNDVWARDYGPIMVRSAAGTVTITDWEYNAWGGKYPPWSDDNSVPEFLSKKFKFERVQPGIVLEGGSIDTNGNGILLTTESVLLNPNRNPGLSKQEIESTLAEYLGIEKVIWLKNGLAGDDTDGHIDDIARFVNKNTIVAALPEDTSDVNYRALKDNYEILKSAADLNGKLFNIITIPMPVTKIEGTTVDGSEYVPASYANFYLANGVVLLPLYDEKYDEEMIELFSDLFPERDIAGIECSDLVWGQGSIHCITQQLYGTDA